MDDKEYQRQYQIERYHRRRNEAIERLGGKCVNCGTIEDLQFDHIDPTTKEIELGRLWGVSKVRFDREISKCQLLCHPCHVIKTLRNRDAGKGFLVHGTDSMYHNAKCRCDLCSEAHRIYMRSYMSTYRNNPRKTCFLCKKRTAKFVPVDDIFLCLNCSANQ